MFPIFHYSKDIFVWILSFYLFIFVVHKVFFVIKIFLKINFHKWIC